MLNKKMRAFFFLSVFFFLESLTTALCSYPECLAVSDLGVFTAFVRNCA